jgi:hypothetical protein
MPVNKLYWGGARVQSMSLTAGMSEAESFGVRLNNTARSKLSLCLPVLMCFLAGLGANARSVAGILARSRQHVVRIHRKPSTVYGLRVYAFNGGQSF